MSDSNDNQEPKEFDWFDKAENRRKLWWAMWIACGIAIVAELFVHRHPHFGKVDGWFGFYAVLGFGACTAMIWIAKWLGYVLKRPETYYEDDSEEPLPDDIDPDLRS